MKRSPIGVAAVVPLSPCEASLARLRPFSGVIAGMMWRAGVALFAKLVFRSHPAGFVPAKYLVSFSREHQNKPSISS